MVDQSPPAGARSLPLRTIQKNVASPMSFLTTVLSQSNSASGAPSATEPLAPQVPNSASIASIRSRLSPYQPGFSANVRQPAAGVSADVPDDCADSVPEPHPATVSTAVTAATRRDSGAREVIKGSCLVSSGEFD